MTFQELHKLILTQEKGKWVNGTSKKGNNGKHFLKFNVNYVNRKRNKYSYYHPRKDKIFTISRFAYNSLNSYYKMFFHELVHYTGHPSRLNRGFITKSCEGKMANVSLIEKAEEELTAEIGAILLCEHFNLKHNLANSILYLRSWKTDNFQRHGLKGLNAKRLEGAYNQAVVAVKYILDNNMIERV